MKPTAWFDALHACQHQGESYVLVTVLTAAGSTPRESGCKMLFSVDSQYDTIGGGHLEFLCAQRARELLIKGQSAQHIESFPLAEKLGQCCGGAVKVLFEAHVNHTQHFAVFGMGHVAQALVPILAQLPLQIRWVDERPALCDTSHLPENVKVLTEDDSVAEMADLPEGAWALILTHNHQLDYDLVERGLRHGQLGYLGMIGSDTKAERFRLRLKNRGFTDSQIETLTSPIGELSIPGKRPVEVAVSISAQIIQMLNRDGPAQRSSTLSKSVKKRDGQYES